MSVSIERGVRKRLDNPAPTNKVELIVDLKDVDSKDVIGDIESAGTSVEVQETLPFSSLAVIVEEQDLEALCGLEFVSRVEIEGEGAVLNPGN